MPGCAHILAYAERSAERLEGVGVRALALAALQGADALRGEARPLGQLLLGQAGRLAQPPQLDAKGGRLCLGLIVLHMAIPPSNAFW
jgi:hypothetical protein